MLRRFLLREWVIDRYIIRLKWDEGFPLGDLQYSDPEVGDGYETRIP